ncbi:Solute carrier family 40 member 3, chloroplastic [Linum grandiflorum]
MNLFLDVFQPLIFFIITQTVGNFINRPPMAAQFILPFRFSQFKGSAAVAVSPSAPPPGAGACRWLRLYPITKKQAAFYRLNGLQSMCFSATDDILVLPEPDDEYNATTAAPAYPFSLYAFYGRVMATVVTERLWEFAWPSAITLLHPSLLPVALMTFSAKVGLLIGGPFLGKLMDYYPKLPANISLNVVQQGAAQLLSAAIIIQAYSVPPSTPSFLSPWFVLLVIVGAIERLCGVALGITNYRYWVVQLAGRERPIALAQANAVLYRIELLSEIVGSLIFGISLCKYDPVTCLKLASTLIAWSLPLTIGLAYLTDKLSSGVLSDTENDDEVTAANGDQIDLVGRFVETFKLGWKEYIQQPVLPASVAYVLGSFNVVLCPGSLMTAFLTQRGSPSIIGAFSGLCAATGVATTFLTERLVKKLGILKAIAFGCIFQASLLVMAVTVYWSGSLSHHQSPIIFFFLGLIVISRVGSTSTEVVGEQILQIGIPARKANLIGITEASVVSLAESLMLALAIVAANHPYHFGLLVMMSAVAAVGSTFVFCKWAMNPTVEQRRLFSSHYNLYPITTSTSPRDLLLADNLEDVIAAGRSDSAAGDGGGEMANILCKVK